MVSSTVKKKKDSEDSLIQKLILIIAFLAEISVPDLMTTPAPTHKHHMTHDGYHHLGQQTSSSTSTSLQCTTRYSTFSEIGDDKTTSVACLQDEVLTSCSMITRDHQYFRDGDKIQLQSGTPVCQAVNAWRSTAVIKEKWEYLGIFELSIHSVE